MNAGGQGSQDPQLMKTDMTGAPGRLRNEGERWAQSRYAALFSECPDSLEAKLDNFPKYVRLQSLTRLLTRYEIFKKIVDVKGSIIECGVFRGAGVMTWANLSTIVEPANFMRKVYGFDSFDGFPTIAPEDHSETNRIVAGGLRANCYEELTGLVEAFDSNRYLGHLPKVELVRGDATQTIPQFVERNKHLVVSLLFLDFDLFEPTRVALEAFIPRMPRGAVVAFDELDHPAWPGETVAVMQTLGLPTLRLKRLEFDPYVSYATLE